MTLSTSVKWCSLVLIILSLMAFGVSSGGLGAGVLALFLAVLGWWYTEGTNARALPKWFIATLLVLVIARGLWAMANRPASSIAPFLSFLASIMVVKCWEVRSTRDVGQIISIATFVLIGSALGGNSFGTGLIVAISFPILVHAAILLQLDIARARVHALRGGHTSIEPPHRTRPVLVSTSLSLLGLGIGAIVFVIVPRTQGSSSLAALGLGGARVSAFRDQVRLGQAGLINLSQSIALEVQVPTENGVPPVAGTHGELYLRGAALENYNHFDGHWTRRSSSSDEESDRGESFTMPGPLTLTPHAPSVKTVELTIRDRDRGSDRRAVFSPWRPISISPDRQSTTRIDRDLSTGTAEFLDSIPTTYHIICAVESGAIVHGRRSRPAWRDEESTSDTLRAFAARALANSGISPLRAQRPSDEDDRAVRVLENYLRENFTYTRELLAAPANTPPIDWFLVSAKEGHCEYFAGALAALCRSVGINARVVTGYVSGEFDPDNHTYTVRQAGAHAWVEAEVGPNQWRTFDATPAEEVARLSGEDDGVLVQFERWFAGLETAWNSSILNFGQQRNPSDTFFARASTRLVEWLRRAEERIKSIGIIPIITWSLIGLGAASLVFAALGAVVKVSVRKFQRRHTPGSAVRGEAAALYARTIKAWKRLGNPKPHWRGAIEHAQLFSGDSRTHAERVLHVCYAAFFGTTRPTDEDFAAAAAALRQLERLAKDRGNRAASVPQSSPQPAAS